MPADPAIGDEPAGDELGEVGARRRRLHASDRGELARGQRVAVEERDEHGSPGGLPHQASGFCEIGVTVHTVTIRRRHFARQRIVHGVASKP
ncbi:hypothetical protein [Agromyces albus]|uniref:hypothetical protein n=1 Tax=Agromyces albus TaxID=205332 RepID=UPI002785FCE7|nr:hypothetical protein [Agromyces albus]